MLNGRWVAQQVATTGWRRGRAGRHVRRGAVTVVAIATALVAGCSPIATQPQVATPASGDAATTPSARAPSASATTVTGVTPIATFPASHPAAEATPPDASSPDAPPALPPQAVLVVAGEEYPGRLSSYSFGGRHADGPYLPGSALEPVPVRPGTAVRVRLAGDVRIARWSAAIAPASDPDGYPARSLGEGTGDVTVTTPRSGAWGLTVSVKYGDDAGDGVYVWHLLIGR